MKFKRVKLGDQIWMAENLDVNHFRNGDLISEITEPSEWDDAAKNGEPAFCYYENRQRNNQRHGKLYNWFAVNDKRGLAPKGWRIPNEDDFLQFKEFLSWEFSDIIQYRRSLKLNKSPIKYLYHQFIDVFDLGVFFYKPFHYGFNKEGFNAVASGWRHVNYSPNKRIHSYFGGKGQVCLLWSNTFRPPYISSFESESTDPHELVKKYSIKQFVLGSSGMPGIEEAGPGIGASVRCIKE